MKVSLSDFPKVAELVKSDERYEVYDFKMKNLVVSTTLLHKGKETTGHSHSVEEVYFFAEGKGEVQLNDKRHKVKKNDIVVIPRGYFHKVFNTSGKRLIFICVFEKYGERR